MWSSIKKDLAAQQHRRRLEFVPAKQRRDSVSQVETNGTGVAKTATLSNTKPHHSVKCSISDKVLKEESGLFDPAIVANYLVWKKVSRVGPGFFNQGNSCFLNSTLQCLMYIPPLVQIFQYHRREALKNIKDDAQPKAIMLMFDSLINEVWSTKHNNATISPRSMFGNLRRVGKQFRPFRQEDAHEYLRQLLDFMHEEVLKANGIKISQGKIAETTVFSRTFGGELCNKLSCSRCGYSSETFNHFQDLSLEINAGISSVKDAIASFTKPEFLSHGNEWNCSGCKTKVKVRSLFWQ
jgi:ubiquitin carboxyl-terminal hydrolase 36/42